MALALLRRNRQFRPNPSEPQMLTAIRRVLLGALFVGVAVAAQASTLTLNFSGSVDLTLSGGTADNPFSGFFTWDPAKTPFESYPPDVSIYEPEAYEVIFNGVPVDPSFGAGVFVFNDADAFGVGDVDALMFFAILDSDPILGDTALLLAFAGDTGIWDTLSLPSDYSFLSQMWARSGMSLEVPDGGDENDISLGRGSLEVTVPEPATLALTALGLVGLAARARRRRV